DQAPGGASGETGVRIECYHVTDAAGDLRHTPIRSRAGTRRAPQQMIELLELPALALPSHPLLFARVPDPAAVEQHEALARVGPRAIAPVQARDALGRGGEELLILRPGLGGRVDPVGEKRKVEVAVWIGEEMDLEPIDLLLDLGLAR